MILHSNLFLYNPLPPLKERNFASDNLVSILNKRGGKPVEQNRIFGVYVNLTLIGAFPYEYLTEITVNRSST